MAWVSSPIVVGTPEIVPNAVELKSIFLLWWGDKSECPIYSYVLCRHSKRKKTATLSTFTHTFWQSHLHHQNPGVVMAHWYKPILGPGELKKGPGFKPWWSAGETLCQASAMSLTWGMQWGCYVGSAVVCFKIVKKDQSDGKLVLSYSFNGPPLHLVLGATSHIQKQKDRGSCCSRV